jgi:hypothetical protein
LTCVYRISILTLCAPCSSRTCSISAVKPRPALAAAAPADVHGKAFRRV